MHDAMSQREEAGLCSRPSLILEMIELDFMRLGCINRLGLVRAMLLGVTSMGAVKYSDRHPHNIKVNLHFQARTIQLEDATLSIVPVNTIHNGYCSITAIHALAPAIHLCPPPSSTYLFSLASRRLGTGRRNRMPHCQITLVHHHLPLRGERCRSGG